MLSFFSCIIVKQKQVVILKLLFQYLLGVLRNKLMFMLVIFIMPTLSLWLHIYKNGNPLLIRILQAYVFEAASKWKVKWTYFSGIAQYPTIKVLHKTANVRICITNSKRA